MMEVLDKLILLDHFIDVTAFLLLFVILVHVFLDEFRSILLVHLFISASFDLFNEVQMFSGQEMLCRISLPRVPPSVTQGIHRVTMFPFILFQDIQQNPSFLHRGWNEFEGIQEMINIQVPFCPTFESQKVNPLDIISYHSL